MGKGLWGKKCGGSNIKNWNKRRRKKQKNGNILKLWGGRAEKSVYAKVNSRINKATPGWRLVTEAYRSSNCHR